MEHSLPIVSIELGLNDSAVMNQRDVGIISITLDTVNSSGP